MYFVNYNDYELLYLIQEGSEQAFNVLYHKYNIYIIKIINRYQTIGDKYYDLYQECLIVLSKCIKRFNNSFNVNFFSYFTISIKRRIAYLFEKNGYYNKIVLCEKDIGYGFDFEINYLIRNYHYFVNDDIDEIIFDECILGGCSLNHLCNKYGFRYRMLYHKKNALLAKFKKALTNWLKWFKIKMKPV